MEQKGIFISYQMAEAILVFKKLASDGVDLSTAEGKKIAEAALEELKGKWLNDTAPGTNDVIGDKFAGMQDITIEDVLQASLVAKNAETYTLENAGAFQYILVANENGEFDFDFSKLDIIASLVRNYNKENNSKIKLIIDSAVVWGDHYPDKLKHLDKETISKLIAEYTQKLVGRYGDILERIDVLNSIFQRGNVSEGNRAEDFWIQTFGKDYGKQIIDIVRSNIDFSKHDIKLCWNEFYLTNSAHQQRKMDFLETVKSIDELDVVGVQDRFVTGENVDYIIETLREISNVSREHGKDVCVTEFSCSVSGVDLRNSSTEVINSKIQNIMDAVRRYCENDGNIKRIEGRMSDKFDFNYKELKDKGFDVSTTGRSSILPYVPSRDEVYPKKNKASHSETTELSFDTMTGEEVQLYQQIQADNQIIKQEKAQQKQLEQPRTKKLIFPTDNYTNNNGFVNAIMLALIVGCVCCILFLLAYLVVGA